MAEVQFLFQRDWIDSGGDCLDDGDDDDGGVGGGFGEMMKGDSC